MSSTLNLLSDSTFGSKIDEQNAILEDIAENIGGGVTVPDATTTSKGIVLLSDTVTTSTNTVPTCAAVNDVIQSSIPDTSSLIYGGTPDASSVVQLKKKDPVSGNDVNVYPALAPSSGVGRILLPKSTGADWGDDVVIYDGTSYEIVNGTVIGTKGFKITLSSAHNAILHIRHDLLTNDTSITNPDILLSNVIIISTPASQYPFYVNHNSYFAVVTYNNIKYLAIPIMNWSNSTFTIIV